MSQRFCDAAKKVAMNYRQVNYETFAPVDVAVCVCAGPSIHDSIPLAKEYCKGRSSVVLCSNYDLHPDTDYVVFIDHVIFKKFINKTKCRNVIINSSIYDCHKSGIKELDKNVYRIMTDDSIAVCQFHSRAKEYNLTKIRVKENGAVCHQIGNAGMATIFAGHYFIPKEIVVLGFEGPTDDNTRIPKHNGRLDKYSKATVKTIPSKRHYVSNMLVPFLKQKGIKVSAFNNDTFWGIDRSIVNWI